MKEAAGSSLKEDTAAESSSAVVEAAGLALAEAQAVALASALMEEAAPQSEAELAARL